MPSRNAPNWTVYPQLTNEQFHAAEQATIKPVLAQLLHNRGLTTPQEMLRFIRADYDDIPDPLTLIDMPRAVERIRRALETCEHITVYGDYDADGVTSSALLYRALKQLKQPGALLDYHIPHRLKDGCGLNLPALDQLKARGTSLIITTDCASSDVAQVAYAAELGIDVIITDHHHPPTELPQAYAMVNPWRPDSTYGERYLCGVGVAFKLTQALYRAYQLDRELELELLDLVAIGTIADIAPLLGENHTLVRLGMQRLNATRKVGLQALIRNASMHLGRLRERDIAFGLAPRINAAGRMQEASLAFDLLTTDDPDVATTLARELEQLNQLRQQQTEDLMRDVRLQSQQRPDHAIILVTGDNWHEGIIGLVAGKLSEETNKPVLVLSNDPTTSLSRGSARSQKGFNVIEALSSFADQLERYGGHAQAGGFTIQSERIEQFREHLLRRHQQGDQYPSGPASDVDSQDHITVTTDMEPVEATGSDTSKMVDMVLTRVELLSYKQYQQLRQISPFGASNPEPVFKMEHLHLLDAWTSGMNRQNLRLKLEGTDAKGIKHRFTGTMMRGASKKSLLEHTDFVDIVFHLEASDDANSSELWLKILNVEQVE